MKELVEYIARSIVDAPDQVVVTQSDNDTGGLLFRLTVAAEDKGRVIGKQGQVAEAMRTLLRVTAARAGTRARLEIV